jgi:FkbM family methyltransferase
MKKIIKQFLASRGYYLFKEGFLPKGISFGGDLRTFLNLDGFRVVMDVGAYHGWMTSDFLKTFPRAHIIAVEPSGTSFTVLQSKFQNNSRVSLENCGAGREATVIQFRLFENGQLNSFKQSIHNDEAESVDVTEVDVLTIETILHHAIPKADSIDFLKIDVEGFELECLEGAANLLDRKNIGCIMIEIGFCDDDERHTPFQFVSDLLIEKGFSFYGLYDLYHYRKRSELLFANALFVNESYIKKNNLLLV